MKIRPTFLLVLLATIATIGSITALRADTGGQTCDNNNFCLTENGDGYEGYCVTNYYCYCDVNPNYPTDQQIWADPSDTQGDCSATPVGN